MERYIIKGKAKEEISNDANCHKFRRSCCHTLITAARLLLSVRHITQTASSSAIPSPHSDLGCIAHAVGRLQRNGTAFTSVADATKARAASLALSTVVLVSKFIKGLVSPGIVNRTGALVCKARKCKSFADVENLFSVNHISQERIFSSVCRHTIGRSQRLGSNVFDEHAQDV